jgi:hypothetical protein
MVNGARHSSATGEEERSHSRQLPSPGSSSMEARPFLLRWSVVEGALQLFAVRRDASLSRKKSLEMKVKAQKNGLPSLNPR